MNLLYESCVRINDNIRVMIPDVGTILQHENDYYRLVSVLTAMPYDMMVQLDDIGIDFTEINDYELFLLLFSGLKDEDTSLLFGDLDLSGFNTEMNEKNGTVILKDHDTGIVIDRGIYTSIANALREIHHLEKNIKKPGNEDAKKYLLERTRKKMSRRKGKKSKSELQSLIVAMVNTNEFKYNFETVKELSIYQFNESVHQILRKTDWDNRMHGVYAGTIDASKLSEDELSFISRK